jgi:hypothetical protein
MQMFDHLPPRLRQIVRDDTALNVGFILVALDDGMSEDEIIQQIKEGSGWITK